MLGADGILDIVDFIAKQKELSISKNQTLSVWLERNENVPVNGQSTKLGGNGNNGIAIIRRFSTNNMH